MTERSITTGKKVLFTAGIVLMFALVFSSCKKEDDLVPGGVSLTSVTPEHNGAVDAATTTDLKWAGASATKYNIYFSDQAIPVIYKTGVTAQNLNVPVTSGKTYYWQVGTIDASGRETLSQIYSFRVKMLIDLDKFTGPFDCDEPKYSHYDVTMAKAGKDTLQNDNFWDLRWKINYVFDDKGTVKIVPATFSPDPSLKVSVSGTGTFDNAKNEFKVTYVVLQDASAGTPMAIEIDRNTHTFAKK
ncbi:MAG: hypothetical protein ACM3UT_12930 [Chloroflexota bacterium]